MRSSAATRRIAAAALAILAAACQPLPHPFAPDPDAPPNPLTEIKDGAGVAVLDLSGAPAPAAKAFVPALIKALLDRDIPAAFSAGNRMSFFAYGEASTKELAGGRLDVELAWHLVDPSAREVAGHVIRARSPRADWESGQTALMSRLAGQVADGIAAALMSGGQVAARLAGGAPRTVYIGPPEGNSGLDGDPLGEALTDELRARGIRVTPRPGPKDQVLKVALTLGPPVGERRRLRVAWRLVGPDGGTRGRIEQANDVDQASLGPGWPRLAAIIATAAAGEIAKLIERAAPPAAGR